MKNDNVYHYAFLSCIYKPEGNVCFKKVPHNTVFIEPKSKTCLSMFMSFIYPLAVCLNSMH